MKTTIPTLIFQEETNECGLACVAMLAQTQGQSVSLETLRDIFPASDHGTSLDTLMKILARLGIATTPVLFEHHELRDLPLPAILHYGASHYVLLAWRKGNQVCVMNPAIGEQWLPFSALKQEISGYALVVEPEQTLKADPDLPLSTAGQRAPRAMSMRETAAVPGIYRLMLLTFLVSLSLFLMPTMVSNAINQAFSSVERSDFPYGWFIVAFVAASLMALGVRVISERFIKRFVLLHSGTGFARLLSNPLRFFEKRAPGEIFSRFTAWQVGLLQKIELDNGLRSDWVICAIALAVMFWIAPVLAAISAVGVTVMGIISVWAVIRDRWFTQQIQLKSATLNDFFMETLQGILTVKTAGLTGQRQGQFAALSRDLFSCLQRQKIYQQVKEGLYQLTGSLEMVVFMLVVLPMVHGKLISLGDFFAYSFLRQIFTSYVTRIFYAIIQKTQLNVIDTRAHSLFAPQNAQPPAPLSDRMPSGTTPDLRFEALRYDYDPGKPILNGVSFSLKAGEQIAIIGESGAGKSTLLRLIAGLFAPQSGGCYAGETRLPPELLTQFVCLQSQEDILFNAPVRDNITLFDAQYRESDRGRIEALLDALALGDVVRGLPGGIDALIRESHAALSLGQRQRLLLARALYSTRPVLLLDEPTANLDEETAATVMDTIRSQCRQSGKSLIVVTHSDKALAHFSRVYRLADGQLQALEADI
ncbi:peptidase domain-containing ABC transporter [Citrobacter rodentium]|uniref:ABC transporter ATP-binding/permease protein n=2 Tax=Citrobacter rodentium TaxID=67825 RepID=D2TQT4_CITRI|nr:cysteine peptidase family C39 domain-containing protein [Citrobacter rodentium]KIQ49802.1 ABC transporter ATP-binding protein [Citrobacter rodentium]QBY29874.1 ATP-binding cassette domain-containing protein [Citrobacter rodentium]UHO32737.1 ATP-binding cassette domain-containing protein [Citrobacter rodentium NBRC 105723 = DSM 16636]CBG90220.1 ABC transporter ATP-binding/permease protein [Citrobacter rodentium ICC168]HAT8014193.1 ABC transporter ATP-binding protein [Citrobacter rodentium NB